MRHYLTVKYNEKDEAKKVARDNGTAIRWDAAKKKWYWEGNGDLPACLEAYASPKQETKEVLYLVWREQYGSKIMYRTDKMASYDIAGKKELASYVRNFEETENCDIQNDPNAFFMKTASIVREGKCLLPRIHNMMKQQVGEAIRGWEQRGEI